MISLTSFPCAFVSFLDFFVRRMGVFIQNPDDQRYPVFRHIFKFRKIGKCPTNSEGVQMKNVGMMQKGLLHIFLGMLMSSG
jgi:hypothetical protein